MNAKLIFVGLLLSSQASHAVPFILPERCAHDNLNQWTEGTAIAGTARGRNEWMKVCAPERYEMVFPGDNEFDPNLPTRRSYPTYGIITGKDANNQPIFITDGYVAPTAPPAHAGAAECIVRAPNKFVGLCTSGCVTPESEITTAQGRWDIRSMRAASTDNVLVPLEGDSGALTLSPLKVKGYIRDMISAQQPILLIRTVSGGEVQVSKNHPLLTGQHMMAKAEDLKLGDSLVTADGKSDLIVEIKEETYFGRLYNLTVDTSKNNESLYVVGGYISGDKKFQDAAVSEFNRRILREVAFESLSN